MESDKEELERLRKLELVNLKNKQRNLKQREISEARRFEKGQKFLTIQPVETNITYVRFGDEESK